MRLLLNDLSLTVAQLGPDFVLVAWVADMPAWNALVQRLFTQDANVRNVKTFFSVHRAKYETALPLPAAP